MNSIKNFLKKSVLMVVATASLVTVDSVANTVNNVAHAETYKGDKYWNQQYNPFNNNPFGNDGKWKSTATWINKNAKPTVMPIYERYAGINQNNKKYLRSSSTDVYFEGVPVRLDSDGALNIMSNQKWIKAMEKPSFWKNHPEFNLLQDNINYQNPSAYRNPSKYAIGGLSVNIESLYKQVYSVNLNALLTNQPLKNQYKYFKRGMSPSKYMLNGYNADHIRQVRIAPMLVKNYVNNLFDHKVHNVVYLDQRTQSDHNDFGTKTSYRKPTTTASMHAQNKIYE
ncbi:hypothetical protein [Lactobacillus sp. Sy-1]|uniref:hypothetical protein n=1 Tax=Lactobacillus sp. Sy-1 TaxID=2109645 RepID=UPI001C5A7FBF|nr:hypothetical protein [Lactobacillus sp. Sy-1]MBW1606455.1 hypothetical protein [Lactobacillus sp. Sy-1]